MHMTHIFTKNESIQEYTQRELAKEIRKESKGHIPADVREHLAKRTVARMDFSNSYQMHKSLRGYAEILVQNYYAKNEETKWKKLLKGHLNL